MKRARLFAIASLLTLGVGGAGFAAYLGWHGSSQIKPGDLVLLPAASTLVAYIDVHQITTSELREQLGPLFRNQSEARQRFQEHTGIDIERDIHRVLMAAVPAQQDSGDSGGVIVLARGRFDQEKIEALMRERGAQVDEYKGVRMVVGEPYVAGSVLALGFVEQDLIAVGNRSLVHTAIELRDGGASIAANTEIMGVLPELESSHAWAAGRLDALSKQTGLPFGVPDRLPPLRLFTASARVDSGLQGRLRVEARDEQAAGILRDAARGLLALARVQSAVRPELRAVVDTLQLGGTGTTVTLSFDVPASAFAALGSLAPPASSSSSPR